MAKLVEQAPNAPGQCLVSQDIEGPFIDAECWAPWVDPYVYLSARWVEETARDVLGMVPQREVEKELQELRDQVAKYGEEVAELHSFIDATVEYEEMRLENGAGI